MIILPFIYTLLYVTIFRRRYYKITLSIGIFTSKFIRKQKKTICILIE